MKVKFVKYNENARIPEKAHPSDMGFDVYAVSEKQIAPNVWQYGLGFGLQIERGWEKVISSHPIDDSITSSGLSVDISMSPINLSIDFRPRSSVWKTGMSLANCEATGDENYTGEYKLNFYHVLPDMNRYRVGDKIAQCKLGMAFPMEFVEVDKLNETDRGNQAFGSSDK